MSDTPRHSVSVAAVIVNESGEVLLTQRADNGHWEPPGGVLELDEAIEDGLRREVREETGLDIEIERLTGVYKNMRRGIVALVFRCRLTDSTAQARLSSEVHGWEWTSPRQAAALMDEAYSVRMTDAFESEGPMIREHDGRDLLATSPLSNPPRKHRGASSTL